LTHAPGNHGAGQTQKDEAFRIGKHFPKDLKTLKDVPALKRGVPKGLNQIENGMNLFKVTVLDRAG
jgi:hypothetical protein